MPLHVIVHDAEDFTSIVTEHERVPPLPVVVSVYFCVDAGETGSEPFTSTAPIPLMEAPVAREELHVNFAVPPSNIEAESAEILHVGACTAGAGAGGTLTLTYVEHSDAPPGPYTLNTYVWSLPGAN